MVTLNRPSEPPAESAQAAFDKATEGGRWSTVRFDPRSGEWHVPSATNTERTYTVTVRNVNVPSNSWWQRLRCNCTAGAQGLAVCWHKAAVYLRRAHQLREQRYYLTAEGLGSRLANPRPSNRDAHGQEPEPTGARRVAADSPGVESDRPNAGRGVLDGPTWPNSGDGRLSVDPPDVRVSP